MIHAINSCLQLSLGHRLFSQEVQVKIQTLASEINDILFDPRLQTPIKTLDLPIAGKLYSAHTLPLIVDMINIVTTKNSNLDDNSGEETISVLNGVRRVAYLMNSNHASSLGLHPAVYFYSKEGRHKTASFFAITDFVTKLAKQKRLNDFIDVRPRFESFILEYDYLIQQINRKHRTAQASYPYVSKLFELLIQAFKTVNDDSAIVNLIQSTDEFNYLSLQKPAVGVDGLVGAKFDSSAKSAIYLRDVLKTAPKCKICGGYIHKNSISFDHINRRSDGGSSSIDNGQIAHPYCNTGYKN